MKKAMEKLDGELDRSKKELLKVEDELKELGEKYPMIKKDLGHIIDEVDQVEHELENEEGEVHGALDHLKGKNHI